MSRPLRKTLFLRDDFGPLLLAEIKRTKMTSDMLKNPPLVSSSYVRALAREDPQRAPSPEVACWLLKQLGWRIREDPTPDNGEQERTFVAEPPADSGYSGETTFVWRRAPRRRRTSSPDQSEPIPQGNGPLDDVQRTFEGVSSWLNTQRLGRCRVTVDGDVWQLSLEVVNKSRRIVKVKNVATSRKAVLELGVDLDAAEWEELSTWVASDRMPHAIHRMPPGLWPLVEASYSLARPEWLPPGGIPETGFPDPFPPEQSLPAAIQRLAARLVASAAPVLVE